MRNLVEPIKSKKDIVLIENDLNIILETNLYGCLEQIQA